MSKIETKFSFITSLFKGNKDTVLFEVEAIYYPNQCDTDGLSYDLEKVYSLHTDMKDGYEYRNDVTSAFQISDYNDDKFADDIRKATESHIQYLLGDKSEELIIR